MLQKLLLLCLVSVCSWGQELPDREVLAQKFLQADGNASAAKDLMLHFQMGGLRTLIRTLNQVPLEQRMQYASVLRYSDLFRFRNELNANLLESSDAESKALALLLLSTCGRQLASEVFEPHFANEGADMRVRLAAGSGLVKIQNVANYDRFLALADKAIVDPGTGQDDLAYADLDRKNIGFYLYSKSRLEDKKTEHGILVTTIHMMESGDVELCNLILDTKKKKYVPLLIDRAIKAGAVDLIDAMLAHKQTRKMAVELGKAKEAAAMVAQFRGKFTDKMPPSETLFGARVPRRGTGPSNADGWRAAYAVVKIDAAGAMEVVGYAAPFGGGDNLKTLLSGTTLPAFNNWEPIESYALVVAP